MIELTVNWQDKWQWWHRMYPSAYAKGKVASVWHWEVEIYRHKESGQLRVYTGSNWDGEKVSVNGEPPQTLRRRGRHGRHGRLHLGFKED